MATPHAAFVQTFTSLLVDGMGAADDGSGTALYAQYAYDKPAETQNESLYCVAQFRDSTDTGSSCSDADNDLDAMTEFITEWGDDLDIEMVVQQESGGNNACAFSPVGAEDAGDVSWKTESSSPSTAGRRKSTGSAGRDNSMSPRSVEETTEIERLEHEARVLGETLMMMRKMRSGMKMSPTAVGAIMNVSRWHTEARKQRRLLLHAEGESRKLKAEIRVQKDRARSLYRILMKRVAKVALYCVVPHVPNATPFVDTNDCFPRLLAETNAMVAQVDAMKKLLREKVALPTKNGSFREWSVKHETSSGVRLELIDSEELPFSQSHVNRAIEAMYRAYEVDQVAREISEADGVMMSLQSFNASDGTIITTTLSQFAQGNTIEYTRQWQVARSFITDAASVFVSTMLFEPTTESWEPIVGTMAKMQEWRFVSKCEGGTTVQETIAITSFETSSPAKIVHRGFPYTPESMNWSFSMTNRLLETLLMKKRLPVPMMPFTQIDEKVC
ncbi:hypothetical protein FI667_g3025, partial [Globisporangium splendens]